MKTSHKSFQLFDYQIEAIKKLSSGKVLRGGVGSGKSFTSLFFFLNNYADRKLYIITTATKRNKNEWQDDCDFLDIKNYVVDSWNNILKYKDIKNSFFIFDEAKASGAGVWGKTFREISKHNEWIYLSATPGDTYMDYLNIFIANGYYINKTQFIREHVVYDPYLPFPKIIKYNNTIKLDRLVSLVNVPMKDQRKSRRKDIFIDCFYDDSMYNDVVKSRFDPYEMKPIENPSQYCQVLRKIVNSSYDKILRTNEIIQNNDKLIVFYNFNYELDILRNICDKLKVPYSEYNGHKHQDILSDSEKWVYLVQYTSGAEAWNCILTDTILFYSLNYSYRVIEQSKGRIDRLNSPFEELKYIYLITDSQIDRSIKKCIEKKKLFNEKSFYRGVD